MVIFTPHTNNSTGGMVINTQEFNYSTGVLISTLAMEYMVSWLNYHPSEGVSSVPCVIYHPSDGVISVPEC